MSTVTKISRHTVTENGKWTTSIPKEHWWGHSLIDDCPLGWTILEAEYANGKTELICVFDPKKSHVDFRKKDHIVTGKNRSHLIDVLERMYFADEIVGYLWI